MRRPFGVTVVAILSFLAAGLVSLGGTLSALLVLVFSTRDLQGGSIPLTLAGFVWTAVFLMPALAFGAAAVATGIGLLRLRPWARFLAVMGSTLAHI